MNENEELETKIRQQESTVYNLQEKLTESQMEVQKLMKEIELAKDQGNLFFRNFQLK